MKFLKCFNLTSKMKYNICSIHNVNILYVIRKGETESLFNDIETPAKKRKLYPCKFNQYVTNLI